MTSRTILSRPDISVEPSNSLAHIITSNFFSDSLTSAWEEVFPIAPIPDHEGNLDRAFTGKTKNLPTSVPHRKGQEFSFFIKMGENGIVVAGLTGRDRFEKELPFSSTKSDITKAAKSVMIKLGRKLHSIHQSSKHSRRHPKHSRRNRRSRSRSNRCSRCQRRFRESRRQKIQSGSTLLGTIEEYNTKIAQSIQDGLVSRDGVSEKRGVEPSSYDSGFIGNVSFWVDYKKKGREIGERISVNAEPGKQTGNGVSLTLIDPDRRPIYLGSIAKKGTDIIDSALSRLRF